MIEDHLLLTSKNSHEFHQKIIKKLHLNYFDHDLKIILNANFIDSIELRNLLESFIKNTKAKIFMD